MPPRVRAPKSRQYVFTLNNHESTDLPNQWAGVKDAVWQHEIGANGTHHLQGFVRWTESMTMAQCKLRDSRAHWEICIDPPGAIAYAQKDDTRAPGDLSGPFFIGTPEAQQGKRTDLHDAVKAIVEDDAEVYDLINANPVLLRNRQHLLGHQRDAKRRKAKAVMADKIKDQELRPWQQQLFGFLEGDPDDRTVIWVYETVGNVGKTVFSKHAIIKLDAMKYDPSKKADMIYAYNDEPVVVIDCKRTQVASEGQMDVVYNFCEALKDEYLFNTKFESCAKVFASPHVVVTANIPPHWLKWSADRYAVYRIEGGSQGTLVEVERPSDQELVDMYPDYEYKHGGWSKRVLHHDYDKENVPVRGIHRQNGFANGFNPE